MSLHAFENKESVHLIPLEIAFSYYKVLCIEADEFMYWPSGLFL